MKVFSNGLPSAVYCQLECGWTVMSPQHQTLLVTTTSTSGRRLKDDGEETDPIRLDIQTSIPQQCVYVCSRRTSSLNPPMTCRHPCYRLLRCRAVITKNMSRKSNSSFFNGRGHLFKTTLKVTTDLLCQFTLPDVLHFVQWLLGQCFTNIYVSFLRTQSQFQPPRYLKSCSLVPATTACFILVPSIVSISFLFTFKYTAWVFFAFSDSPALPHSISTLRKSCLACLISSDRRTMSSAKSRSVNRLLESYDSHVLRGSSRVTNP